MADMAKKTSEYYLNQSKELHHSISHKAIKIITLINNFVIYRNRMYDSKIGDTYNWEYTHLKNLKQTYNELVTELSGLYYHKISIIQPFIDILKCITNIDNQTFRNILVDKNNYIEVIKCIYNKCHIISQNEISEENQAKKKIEENAKVQDVKQSDQEEQPGKEEKQIVIDDSKSVGMKRKTIE